MDRIDPVTVYGAFFWLADALKLIAIHENMVGQLGSLVQDGRCAINMLMGEGMGTATEQTNEDEVKI